MHGELSKWVPMSRKRVAGLQIDDDDVIVRLTGAVGERVTFTYMWDGKVSAVDCVMNAAGSATLSVAAGKC